MVECKWVDSMMTIASKAGEDLPTKQTVWITGHHKMPWMIIPCVMNLCSALLNIFCPRHDRQSYRAWASAATVSSGVSFSSIGVDRPEPEKLGVRGVVISEALSAMKRTRCRCNCKGKGKQSRQYGH